MAWRFLAHENGSNLLTYAKVSAMARLPIEMTGLRVPIVFAATIGMSAATALLACGRLRRVEPGETIIRRGDMDDAFFIIGAGAVDALRPGEAGGEKRLVTLGVGGFFDDPRLRHQLQSVYFQRQ